jgi:hypothetical protein
VGISEAKQYIGKVCSVSWADRTGAIQDMVSMIHDVTYVPMYGGYLITDTDDIPLEKMTNLVACAESVERAVAA